jgi:hypothetical protein
MNEARCWGRISQTVASAATAVSSVAIFVRIKTVSLFKKAAILRVHMKSLDGLSDSDSYVVGTNRGDKPRDATAHANQQTA